MIRIVGLAGILAVVGISLYFILFRPNVSQIQKVSDSPEVSKQPPNENLEEKVQSLEDKIASLESKLSLTGETSSKNPSQVVVSSSKSPQYIYALGSSGSISSTNSWETVSSLEITIDPVEFPGYKSMQLEAFIRLHQGNGKMFARLYHQSSGLAVPESEVSTSSENNTWVSSNTFRVSEKKTYKRSLKTSFESELSNSVYKFQLKTLTGYTAYIEDARVKVNF